MFAQIRSWARQLKSDVVAVYFSARDPRCPWPVRLLAMLVAAYALSPIDLIPDFIPVLGYLDDLLIVPLGLWLVLRMVPPQVLADARVQAAALLAKPRNHVAAVCFVLIWLALLVWLLRLVW
jgi:uncharacterized membrane protein YkvA (DUF1232 family)